MNRGLVILLTLLCISCDPDPYPGYSAFDSEGIFYKVLSFDDRGERPVQGDMIRFKMTMYNADTIWWTTDQVQVIRYDTTSIGLRTELGKFQVGDSLSLIFEPGSLWKEFGFLDTVAGGEVDVHLKVLDVIAEQQWLRAEELDHKVKSKMEGELLEAFMDTCEYASSFIRRADGVYWRTLSPGNGIKYPAWTEMLVNYRALLMDGTIVDDRMNPEDALAYKIGMQGQLVPGLVNVISSMEQGEMVEVILPSELAFGRSGSVGGVVPPWNPVRFILTVSLDN